MYSLVTRDSVELALADGSHVQVNIGGEGMAGSLTLVHQGGIVGPVEDESAVSVYADALPAATLTVCRLHAGRNELTSRLMLRGQGGSWSQPGDPLVGQPATHLLRIAA